MELCLCSGFSPENTSEFISNSLANASLSFQVIVVSKLKSRVLNYLKFLVFINGESASCGSSFADFGWALVALEFILLNIFFFFFFHFLCEL